MADTLAIHPSMLSRSWKEARDGALCGRVSMAKARPAPREGEMKRFLALQRARALLHAEHALLKELIRFTSIRKPRSSPSSTGKA